MRYDGSHLSCEVCRVLAGRTVCHFLCVGSLDVDALLVVTPNLQVALISLTNSPLVVANITATGIEEAEFVCMVRVGWLPVGTFVAGVLDSLRLDPRLFAALELGYDCRFQRVSDLTRPWAHSMKLVRRPCFQLGCLRDHSRDHAQVF